MAILQGNVMIHNSKEFFNFVDSKLRLPQSGIYKQQVFHYVETIPREGLPDYKPVPQNSKIHQISSTRLTEKLNIRLLSCYECELCINGECESCVNESQIGKVELIGMKLTNRRGATIEDVDIEQCIP